MLLTETWLTKDHLDSSVIDSTHYCIIRDDRQQGKGGGVAAIYPKCLAYKISVVTIEPTYDDFNILAFDVFTTEHSSSRYIVVYLPPLSAQNDVIVNNLIHILRKLKTKSELYIYGDFK